jgi:exonuclease VII large subunit
MPSVDEFRARFKTIVKNYVDDKGNLAFNWNSVPEARQHLARIRQMQKEIGLLKKDLKSTMAQVRSSYTAKKSTVQAGFLPSLSGKKSAGHDRVLKRENLRRQQLNDLAPYEYLDRLLDEVLIKLDATKIRIQESIDQNSTMISQQPVNQNQAKPSSVRCDKCGTDNPPEYRFCGSCGTPLFKPPQSAR